MTANQHTARVGFIGLGDQGAPMAQAIGGSGFALHVRARRPQSLEVLARTRHTVHDSAAGLAAAVDILELCLRVLGSDVTPEIAPHIQGLMRKDIEHFADAIRACGLDPQPLHDRGLAGASGLAQAVGLLAAGDRR
jgi:hypothetical protein